ncbi:Hypothetical predicted protein [Paramuricea clavata]|uniref:Uncharacterized protein n=1 Tax=Paramuricea clavata TaxID=317549 RepID=A0A6S7GHX6_PARCT|nr:Hypothetical predicted protein [Paramuricea clavata]
MASDPQLLINEGELNEILRIISAAKNPECKIVGSLFGLWRNSLTQPVVQLATGPGARAKVSKEMFKPDGAYHSEIKEYLDNDHGLLQIGLWCSGSRSRYPRLDRKSREFNLRNTLVPWKGRYVVLMFVNFTRGNLEIEYEIIDKARPESSRNASLTEKDVLPGASSFRLLHPVFDRLNQGAKFSARQKKQTGYFSTSMLQRNHHQPPPPSVPNKAIFVPTPEHEPQPSQWYESDGGHSLLKKLVNGFKSHGVSVDMSRDSNSHDMTLEINRSICLHFPVDFPRGRMSLTWLNDTSRFTRNADEICNTILHRTLNILSHETALSLSTRQTAC